MGFPKFLIEGKSQKIEELQTNMQKKLNCVNCANKIKNKNNIDN